MNVRVGGVVALAAIAWAQERPLIRVSSRLVEVNAIVRDRNGPLAGLRKADFTILDRGRPREIVTFSANSAGAPRSVPDPLPAGVYSNEPERRGISRGSATVVLLDGLNTPIADQLYATRQFAAFLNQIQPGDRIAVYTLGRTLRVLNDFTDDASRLSAALARYQGRNDHARESDLPQLFDTADEKTNSVWNDFLRGEGEVLRDRMVQITVEAMEAVANRIGSIPGRKNLIWVSAGFPFTTGAFTMRAKTYAREVGRAARALNAANIAMYAVDARGLVAMPGLSAATNSPPPAGAYVTLIPAGQDTMDAFAQATGGRVFKNNNDIQGAIRAVLDDSEVNYTLTFRPDPDTLDGTFHPIKVSVKRPGSRVQCRTEYFAGADPPAGEQERASIIRGGLTNPLESSGVRLQVRLARERELAFTVILNTADLAFELSNQQRAATLDVVVSQRAADGRELESAAFTLRPRLDDSKFRESLEKGLGFERRVAPAQGAVEVKILVYDRGSGRTGSIIVPL